MHVSLGLWFTITALVFGLCPWSQLIISQLIKSQATMHCLLHTIVSYQHMFMAKTII